DLSDDEFGRYVTQAALEDEVTNATPAGANPTLSAGGVVTGFLKGLGGVVSGLGNAVIHPIDTVSNLVSAQLAEPVKAYQAFKEGRSSEGLGHGAASLLPIVGPAAAHIGENIAETGDIGEGLGEAGALIASSPSIAGPALRGAGRAGQALAASRLGRSHLG